jgi:hypothetical protein
MDALTIIHTLISLVGIGSGWVVLYGLLTSNRFESWTKLFLTTTMLTSLTGFLFPFHGFKPSYVIGTLSVIILLIAILARYRYGLLGGWRRTYVITATVALYFNMFVLVAQSFMKVPALHDLAPTQSEPPFGIAQLALLLIFIWLGYRAAKGFERGRQAA